MAIAIFIGGNGTSAGLQITGYANPVVGWAIIASSTIIATILLIYSFRVGDEKKSKQDDNPVEILLKMHTRLIQLKDIRLSQSRPKEKQVTSAFPFLLDKLDVIKLKDYDKFRQSIYKRVKIQRTKSLGRIEYKTCYVMVANAREIINELVNSKNWGLSDFEKIGKWLDDFHWGLKELREDDKKWNELYKSIRPYTVDSTLRELISEHISVSYGYCSTAIIVDFSLQWPKNKIASMLYSSLVGTLPSLTDIELALSEIAGKISSRMKVLEQSKKHKTREVNVSE